MFINGFNTMPEMTGAAWAGLKKRIRFGSAAVQNGYLH
jgi:hypothetical protein